MAFRRIKGPDSVSPLCQTVNAIAAAVERLQAVILPAPGNRRGLGAGPTRMFPFRVYQLPWCLREAPSADDWRKFRVRAALVGRTLVSGTDGSDNPDCETFGDGGEFTAPSGVSAYVVWYEYQPGASPSAALKHSSSPATGGGDTYSGDWPGYPGPCTTEGLVCRKIAEIDTSDTTNKIARVRQVLRADEPDWYQACVNVGSSEKVLNVACDGAPFDFV